MVAVAVAVAVVEVFHRGVDRVSREGLTVVVMVTMVMMMMMMMKRLHVSE